MLYLLTAAHCCGQNGTCPSISYFYAGTLHNRACVEQGRSRRQTIYSGFAEHQTFHEQELYRQYPGCKTHQKSTINFLLSPYSSVPLQHDGARSFSFPIFYLPTTGGQPLT